MNNIPHNTSYNTTDTQDFILVSHHLCPYVQRAEIVLQEKGLAHKRVNIDLGNKPDWFLKISPLGKTPVLQVGDTPLFESQVIAEYLNEASPLSLHPDDNLEKARHRAWIEFATQTLNNIAGFYNAPNATTFEEKRAALREKFERLEEKIEGPFFSGEKFYMIDGVWGTVFRYFDVFDQIDGLDTMSDLPKVNQWRKAIAQRSSVQQAVPEDYNIRLRNFLLARKSYLSGLMSATGW